MIALLAVTVLAMTAPAPECRLVRERPFEGRSAVSMAAATEKMLERAAEKGADTVQLEGKYCRHPRSQPCRSYDVRIARGYGYVCGSEVGREEE